MAEAMPPPDGVIVGPIRIVRYAWLTLTELKDFYGVDDATADAISETKPRKKRKTLIQGDAVSGEDDYWSYKWVYWTKVSEGPGEWHDKEEAAPPP